MLNFEDIVGSSRKFKVWQNFTYCKTTEKAKCKLCQAILKAAGSSTKGLITRLKSQHKIAVKSSRVEVSKIDEPKLKIRKIDFFFKSKKQSLGKLVSQLTAIDGLTFNQIAMIKLPQANDYAERLKLMDMICLDRTKRLEIW